MCKHFINVHLHYITDQQTGRQADQAEKKRPRHRERETHTHTHTHTHHTTPHHTTPHTHTHTHTHTPALCVLYESHVGRKSIHSLQVERRQHLSFGQTVTAQRQIELLQTLSVVQVLRGEDSYNSEQSKYTHTHTHTHLFYLRLKKKKKRFKLPTSTILKIILIFFFILPQHFVPFST